MTILRLLSFGAYCVSLFLISTSAFAADTPADAAKQAAANIDPIGVWTWQTIGPNGQPDEATLEVTTGKGVPQASLTDRSGTHPVSDLEVTNGTIKFTVIRNTPNGDMPIQYSISTGQGKAQVAIERNDITPQGRAAGKKRKTVTDAGHMPAKASPGF
jgi:hypothetical protein